MRIGMFSDTYLPDLNGVATSVETLRQALVKHGHEVFVIANHSGLLHLKREDNVLRLPGIELKWLYGYNMSSPIQLKAKEEIRQMNLDVIHVHTEFGVGIFARNIAKELNIPVVSTYHTMYEDYTHYINFLDLNIVDKTTKSLVGNLSKLLYDKSEVIIAPSNKTKDTLRSYDITAPIHVIPTGIDLSNFNEEIVDKNKVSELKRQCGFTENDRIIAYIGRIASEKSIDIVIRGFKKCALKDQKYKLLIVGGGPSLENLKELAVKEGIEKSVVFTDRQNRDVIPAWYQVAEAFVSCSTSETQGMTFIEALASSLPVFAQRDEVLLDLIEEGKSGFFIDESTFSDRLIEFFDYPQEKILEMRKCAREKAKRYDLDIFYENVMSCYEEAYASYFKTLLIKKVKVNHDYVTLTLLDSHSEEVKCLVSPEDYLEFELKKDKAVHEQTFQELKRREVMLNGRLLCIRKLALRDRTRKEMYDILLKDGTLDAKQMNELIEELETKGLINDQAYLKHQLEKAHDSSTGKKRLMNELVRKGLPYEMVRQTIEVMDEENEKIKAARFVANNEKMMKSGSVKMKKQMLISKLMNRGFSFEVAKDVVENYEFAEDFLNEKEALTKAAQKALRSGMRKYSGDELKRYVTGQLIHKGFDSEDIQTEMDEMEIFND